ncbi:MAG TPA: TetR/AcrR family transcriptional regulator [Solirubrobacteraceae bacterium]|nr:TetR/AcrR family transcriptional regulator [Solirubrobacteraceae bacterium]
MSRSAPTNGSAPPEPSGRPPRSDGTRRRALVVRGPHQRIQAATARAIAAHGYEATTIQDICAEADISEATFYEHFKDKQEAAMFALEAGVDQVMTDLQETFAAASSWPDAIWITVDAVLEWMVNEPAFARLALVEMLAAGEAALELLQSLMDAFGLFLEPGYKLLPEKSPSKRLVDETVANAIFGLLHEHIVSKGTEGVPVLLPEMVRRILTPFLGAERAVAFVAQRSAQG